MKPAKSLAFFLATCALLTACQRDNDIQTYRVTKEVESSAPMGGGIGMSPAPTQGTDAPLPPGHPQVGSGTGSDMQAMGAGMTAAGSSKEVTWTVPQGWQEQPATAIRVGSFLIKGANGKTADMSVIPLSGEAGGDLANINRWRGQINLSPIADGDLAANSETIQPGNRKMLFLNVSNDGRRLLAAIYHQGERTWFFKMTGDDATTRDAKPAFLQFLKSLRFTAP